MSENATTTKEAAPTKAAEKLDGLFVASVEKFQEWLMSPGHPSKAFEVFRNVMWTLQFATKARSKLLMTLWYDLMDLMRATHNHRIREWTYEVLVEFTSMRHHIEIVRDNGGLCALREEYSREIGDFSMVSSGARIEVLTMLVRLTLFICHGVPELATPILLDPKIFAMIESVVFNDVLPKDFRRSVWQRYLKVSRFAETQQKKLQPLRVQQLRNPQQYTILMRQQHQQVRMQQQQSSVDGLEHASSGQPETATQTMLDQVTEEEVIQRLQQQPFSQYFMEQQTSVSQQNFAEEQGGKYLQEAQERFWLGERVQTVPPDRQAQHLEQSQLSQLQTQRLQEAYRQEMLNENVRERQQQLMQVQRSKTPQERKSQLAQYKVQQVNKSGRENASKEQVEAKPDLLELLLKVLSERPQENSQQRKSAEILLGHWLNLETQRRNPKVSYQQQIPQQGTYSPPSQHRDLRLLEPQLLSQPQRREMAQSQQYQQIQTSYATRSQIPAGGQWTGFGAPQVNRSLAMLSSSHSQAAGLSRNEATRAKAQEYGGHRADFSLRNYLSGEAQGHANQQRVQLQGRPLDDQGQVQRLIGGQTLRFQMTEENRCNRLQDSHTWNQTPLVQADPSARAPRPADAKRPQNRKNSETDPELQESMLRILERRKNTESDSQRDPPRDRTSSQPELWQPPGRNVPRLQMKDDYIELPDDNEPENI